MNTLTRSRLFKLGLLGLLAACFSAGVLMAQNAIEGNFTLPVEVHWGQATLPAGQYWFALPSNNAPYTIMIRGEGNVRQTVMVMATGRVTNTSSNRSEMVIIRHGSTGTVRALTLADLGLVLKYRGPKGKPQPTIAQAPELIQRIPISLNGK